MRWIVAGLLFALAVSLAVGTAGIRADNVRARRLIEQEYRRVQDLVVELRRLGLERIEATAPERLSELQWRMMRDVARAREEGLQ